MKLNIFSNDKATMKDEIFISVFTLICTIVGIILVVIKPSFMFINQSITVGFGILMLAIAIMFIPCIIWRFMHNTEINKANKNNG